MKKRIITAILIAVVCIPLIYLGGWYTVGLCSLVCFVSIYEILKTGRGKHWSIAVYIVTILGSIALMYWGFIVRLFNKGFNESINFMVDEFEPGVNIMTIVTFYDNIGVP